MRNSKLGLRAFGLALMAALGLMAFSAVAAQAENLTDGGKPSAFLVNLETALAKLGVTFNATQQGTGTLLVPGRVDLLCHTGTTTLGEFHNSTDLLVTATFSNCLPFQPIKLGETHTNAVKCTVKEPIVAEALGLPRLHENDFFVLLEPLEGKTLFTTIFLEGPECPLTKENKVTGSVVALIDKNDTAEPLLLFSHSIQELLGDKLFFGAFPANIDGDATAKLTDEAHKGLPFGVC